MTIANHSELKLKLDLQFFNDEDAILPDDFDAGFDDTAPPEVEEVDEAPVEESVVEADEPTEEQEEVDTPEPTPQTLKIKYNKEEQEITLDEARELAQKGKNYDKVIEQLNELKTDPRLSFVEELAKEQNMDVNQFLDAYKEHKEQERLNQLMEQNIPEDLAKEILESRKDREERQREKESKANEEKQNQEFGEFIQFFKDANGRDFDAEKDKIPNEVWQANEKGIPLKYAYMEHYNNELRSQLQVQKQNEENSKKAPVKGVTQYGGEESTPEDDFLKGFNSI